VSLLVILVAAKVGAELTNRLRQPAVIGELIIGVIVGSSVLGWVNVEDGDIVSILAEIGVILLLFEVGLETDVYEFRRLGGPALRVATLGVVTPFLLGLAAAKFAGLAGGSTEVAIFIGASMTATSVGITARVLAELNRLHTDEAKTIIGAAVIDDIMGLIILAVVVGLLSGDGTIDIGSVALITLKALVFLIVVLGLGIRTIQSYVRFLDWLRVEGSYVVGMFVFALTVGILAERLAGLNPIVGAFAAGMVAGQASDHQRIVRELRPIVYLFVPIFFVTIGAGVDVGVLLDPRVLLIGGVVSVLAIAGKLVAGLGAPSGTNRWLVAVGMVPRGEVGLIFAALGATQLRSVVGSEETAIVVLMVVVTTIVAPLVLGRLLQGTPASGSVEDATISEVFDTPTVGGPEVDEAPS
jgi:Kef-type K+ transport system membrane component KefB